MTGMETVIGLRERRVKPSCVMVDLVAEVDGGQPTMSHTGIVTVQIPETDSIGDMDFRPLIGLYVQVFDNTDDPERHRRVTALIAEQNPKLLVMHCSSADAYTAHVRRAGDPPTTETWRA